MEPMAPPVTAPAVGMIKDDAFNLPEEAGPLAFRLFSAASGEKNLGPKSSHPVATGIAYSQGFLSIFMTEAALGMQPDPVARCFTMEE